MSTLQAVLTSLSCSSTPHSMSSANVAPSYTSSSLPPPSSSTMPGISLGLQRITRLLTVLGNPHHAVPVVHIAGTNGKGSVAAYLASILSAATPPLRVGQFNSPHLVDVWDCIRLPSTAAAAAGAGGEGAAPQPVNEQLFRSVQREIAALSAQYNLGATSFELLTASAFVLFARAQPPLDVAVVEVGMGGSEDATNVVPAEKTLLSVVTAVELDHQKFLGDTVGEIATVKGGIAREGGDLVLAVQGHREAVEAVKNLAKERGTRVWEAGVGTVVESWTPTSSSSSSLPPPPLVSLPLTATKITPPLPSSSSAPSQPPQHLTTHLPLPGSYQLSNAATAVLAASLLRTLPRTKALLPSVTEALTDDAIRRGVEQTKWEGRLSWTSLPCPLPAPSSSASSTSPPSPSSSLHRPLRPLLLDGAHNPSSASLLASYLLTLPPSQRPTTLIFALSSPRHPSSVLPPLLAKGVGLRRIVCVWFGEVEGMEWVRAVESGDLQEGVRGVVGERAGEGEVEVLRAENAEGALNLLEEVEEMEGAGPQTTLVAGSLYLVADVLRVQRRVGDGTK